MAVTLCLETGQWNGVECVPDVPFKLLRGMLADLEHFSLSFEGSLRILG